MLITYRKAAWDDNDTVTDLLCRLYEMPRDELFIENERHFANTDMIFFLAFDGDKPVGISHGPIRHEYVNGADDGPKGYLEAIYVLPDYRLKGVAVELVKEIERWAGLHGCREFASDCLLNNNDSYNFHLKIGFKETERKIFFLKRIEPQSYEIHQIDDAIRKKVQPILDETWDSPYLAVNGKLWDSRIMLGLAAVSKSDDVLGYLLYEFHDGECEIMVLESVAQNIRIASALIGEVRQIAKSSGVNKVIIQTCNDNIKAIRFYQRRGFTIRAVRLGALDAARRLKPAIPLIGEEGIPLRDEIEFESGV